MQMMTFFHKNSQILPLTILVQLKRIFSEFGCLVPNEFFLKTFDYFGPLCQKIYLDMEALALNEFFFLFRKVSEPWELADGCVHLVGEIATIKV